MGLGGSALVVSGAGWKLLLRTLARLPESAGHACLAGDGRGGGRADVDRAVGGAARQPPFGRLAWALASVGGALRLHVMLLLIHIKTASRHHQVAARARALARARRAHAVTTTRTQGARACGHSDARAALAAWPWRRRAQRSGPCVVTGEVGDVGEARLLVAVDLACCIFGSGVPVSVSFYSLF